MIALSACQDFDKYQPGHVFFDIRIAVRQGNAAPITLLAQALIKELVFRRIDARSLKLNVQLKSGMSEGQMNIPSLHRRPVFPYELLWLRTLPVVLFPEVGKT